MGSLAAETGVVPIAKERTPRRIEVPAEVAEAASMPDDLQSLILEPWSVPETARRARVGWVYLAAAAGTVAGMLIGSLTGMWLVALFLVLIAGYHRLSAWSLEIREGDALETANRRAEFAVGHASAAVSFVGWRARPVWNVLLFSADDPPTLRALVRVDGVDGHVVGSYVESVPAAEVP